MQVYGKVPGFKYLHRTSSPDAVVARIPSTGVLGIVGKKQEFMFKRADPEQNSEQFTRMAAHLPAWALEKGLFEQIELEVTRWQFPQLNAKLWQ